MTFDESSTIRCQWFIGINMFNEVDKQIYKTGLVRIVRFYPAEIMLQEVVNHLKSFGLIFQRDLAGLTQDRANMNKKFMRSLKI